MRRFEFSGRAEMPIQDMEELCRVLGKLGLQIDFIQVEAIKNHSVLGYASLNDFKNFASSRPDLEKRMMGTKTFNALGRARPKKLDKYDDRFPKIFDQDERLINLDILDGLRQDKKLRDLKGVGRQYQMFIDQFIEDRRQQIESAVPEANESEE